MDPQEFTVKKATAADLIGTRVGHAYLITGLLGTGGMGNVYRASQQTIGRDVAIKFLPFEIATDATAVQRLGREAKALGQLNHPGIVTTFDFGFTEKQEPYLVLELVEGQSLHKILEKEKRLELARALHIFVQICEAMSYAHSQGLVHRDLKPLNIMVGIREQFEFAKILDFGIVKLTSEVQQLTKSGEIWGSPFYMSPEQCTGGTVDNRSDIYSLGVVMFRCLTGEVPHRSANFPETIARKLSEYPPSFESVAPGLNLPERVEALVLKCLQKQPDERYGSMQELRAELLKNYPNRNESEATLTYEKVDAVAKKTIENQTKSQSSLAEPSAAPATAKLTSEKAGQKPDSPKADSKKPESQKDNSGLKPLIIGTISLLLIASALAFGIAAYQGQQKAVPSAGDTTGGDTTSGDTGVVIKTLPPAVTGKDPVQITGKDPARVPTAPLETPDSNSATTKPNRQDNPAREKVTQKKAPTGSRTKKKAATRSNTAAKTIPPPKIKLRDLLRHTGEEVLQEIRPFRRLRQNDPNSFYRDFGGR